MADQIKENNTVQLSLSFKPIDINEGSHSSMDGAYRLPDGTGISIEDYASYFSSAKSFLSKNASMAYPPQTQSFAKISYMPNNSTTQMGILQWPGLPPESLQKMGREMIGIQEIIQVRTGDVFRFAKFSEDLWSPGWKIVPKDKHEKLNSTLLKEIREAEQFLSNCGYGDYFADPIKRDDSLRCSFSKFLLEIIRDSLIYDGIAIWTDMDEDNKIRSFAPLPAGKVRLLARPDRAQIQQIHEGELNFYGATSMAGKQPTLVADGMPFAVVVDETNNPVKAFTRKELIWYTRNPRVDAEVGGYGYSEIEMALILITGFNNAIQFNADIFDKNSIPKGILLIKGNFCYSEDTEVLTKRGWITFDKVDIQTDEFATINRDNSNYEWQMASEKVWEDYSDTMYHISSRSLDMLVTPNHWILVIDRYKKDGSPDSYRMIQAEELYNIHKAKSTRRTIPVTAIWKGTEISQKTFEIVNKSKFDSRSYNITMTGDQYCAFMGMYLSEGSTSGYSSSDEYINGRTTIVTITQYEKSKGFTPYRQLLSQILGREPYYNGKDLVVCNAGLAEHVSQFGRYSNTKIIPEDILNATPRQLKIFWDYFELGDGSAIDNNNGNNKTIRGRLNGQTHQIDTTSYTMVGQLQEIACKMGYSATVISDYERVDRINTFVDKNGNIKTIKSINPSFKVRLVFTPSHEFRIEKVENYSGKIGCVTVPNHTLYVRRNGKVAFNGNTQKQFNALNKIWDNLQRGNRTDWTLPALQVSEKGEVQILNLEELRKEPAYYNNLINLFMGALATIYCLPVHRLGYKISGTDRDSRPDTPKSVSEEEDVGLPSLLTHVELIINQYILGNRWPHLQFTFTGKTPKEDARLYEIRLMTTTIDERRQMVGLPSYESLVGDEETDMEKLIARLMGRAPVDPSHAGIYQSVLAALAKAGAFNAILGLPMPGKGGAGQEGGKGGAGQSGLGDIPGARFRSKKDPAISEQHGHTSGVRRDSRAETASAPPKTRRMTSTYSTPDNTGYTTVGPHKG